MVRPRSQRPLSALAALFLSLLFLFSGPAYSDVKKPAAPAPAAIEAPIPASELTLERLFPKYAPRAPLARNIDFSADGRYAAYCYGEGFNNDLWLYAPGAEQPRRLTSRDAIERLHAGADRVSYLGVDSYAWAPDRTELLFASGSHLYRWTATDDQITRITKKRLPGFIFSLDVLPGERGYLAHADEAGKRTLWLGRLDGGEPRRIGPTLGLDENISTWALSPDGNQLALTVRTHVPEKGKTSVVWIPRFGGRFLEGRTAWRDLPGDKMSKRELRIEVVALPTGAEDATIRTVFTYPMTGWTDSFSPPAWSPDSKKLAWRVYEQKTGEVRIMEAEVSSSSSGMGMPVRELYRFTHGGGSHTTMMIDPWYLADNTRLVFLTEQTGFRHLCVLDPRNGVCEPITRGDFEVYPLELTPTRDAVYVAAAEEHAACRDLYRVSLSDGRMERLSKSRGAYGDVDLERLVHIAFSPDGRTALANFAAFGSLRELVCLDTTTGRQFALTDSHTPEARRLAAVRPEFFEYKNRHGDTIHGHVFKPADWSEADRRPALIYVYGGPLGIDKQVDEGRLSADGYFFPHYMAAKHGYVTVVIDPRGSSGYGAKFERAHLGAPGKASVEDLVDGVKVLVEKFGVDARRVGIHGWSFGGFLTQMCLYTAPDVFAVGIAGAGPTEWENYNAWYATSVISPSETELRRFSLLPLAGNLKGKLLLVHGMQDDNVLLNDTIEVYRSLLRAGKVAQVELFLDPTGGHGLHGDVTPLVKYTKYEEFLLRHLGTGRRSEDVGRP
jgi:dipeptidyl-peptidase-4